MTTARTSPTKTAPLSDPLTRIAQQHLGVETLQRRDSDDADFHALAVWNVRAALEAAYRAGLQGDAGYQVR